MILLPILHTATEEAYEDRLATCTKIKIKSIKNVTRCRDSRSAESITAR